MKETWWDDFKYEMYGYLIIAALTIAVVLIYNFLMSGLPSETVKRGEQLVKNYEAEYSGFNAKRAAYEASKKESYYQGISTHESTEGWLDYFSTAENEYMATKALLTKVEKLIDQNDNATNDSVNEMMLHITKSLEQTPSIYQYPFERLKSAKEVSTTFDQTVESANDAYREVKREYLLLDSIEIGGGMTFRPKIVAMLTESAEAAKQTVEKSVEMRRAAKAVDLLALHDAQKELASVAGKLDLFLKGDEKAKELLLSEGKILIDMKVRYFFTPVRYSWNNYRDYPSEEVYTYNTVEVGYEQYRELLTKESTQLDTAMRPNQYSEHPPYTLHGQAIFDLWEKWPSSSTHAEYWLKELYPKYYHRYLLIVGDKMTTMDWTEVPEDQFYAHIGHFGMQIMAKPYGNLAKETISYAAPPAMAFVGNRMYGQWQNSAQETYWQFSPEYAALFRPFMLQENYTKSEYDAWKKSQIKQLAFYGVTHRYGTYSVQTYKHDTYHNSSFVRLYIDMADIYIDSVRYRGIIGEESGGGSAGSSTRSAKNSGRSLRGGGPGGYGK